MSDIIDKTYKLLDTLDNSELIKNLTYYKEKLSKNKDILSLVDSYNNETNNSKKIFLKQKKDSILSKFTNWIISY